MIMEESSAYIISGTIGSRSIIVQKWSSHILVFFLLKAQNPEEVVDMSVFFFSCAAIK